MSEYTKIECPRCGLPTTTVKTRDYHSDGVRVRIRRCPTGIASAPSSRSTSTTSTQRGNWRMSKDELRQRVAEARARVAKSRERAEREAADERLLAEAEAQEAADARKAMLDSLLQRHAEAEAEHVALQQEALAAAVEYYRAIRPAVEAKNKVRQTRAALSHVIRPNGVLVDQAEEPYDVNTPGDAVTLVSHGDVSNPFKQKHDIGDQELNVIQLIVSALDY